MNVSAASLAPDKPYVAATPQDGGLVRYRLYIDGRFVDPAGGEWIDTEDPVAGEVWARVPRGGAQDADHAAQAAHRAFENGAWPAMSASRRGALLRKLGDLIADNAEWLARIEMKDNGKLYAELLMQMRYMSNYYYYYGGLADKMEGSVIPSDKPGVFNFTKYEPVGVVLCIMPWNSPLPLTSLKLAPALAAGNTVILKPASDTVLVAWELCQCFWRAGVSKSALQFVPCAGSQEGRKLVNHPKVNAVVLTGGTETALTMLRDKPRLNLFAETGGKNATIVTALSDRDQAIKHLLHSAFGHSGQKCSATSLLLLEAEVYDDPKFRRTLCDAVQSMKVGSAWELESKMGPVIRAPSGDLENALKVLEPGEEWAVMPRALEGNPNLWSPGVKYGVQPGSYTHTTEFFGPVLGVMRFTKLREAVALVNQTGYGLTSGLESLDEREWDYWLEHLRAGNLYLNRVTTGAVVLRQPFGGFGKSVFGPGMKAGGPNYVAQFMDFTDAAPASEATLPETESLMRLCRQLRARAAEGGLSPDEVDRIVTAAASCDQSQREEFSRQHDHFRLVGQDNFRRYLPLRDVRVRVHGDDTAFELFARVGAAQAAGCRITVSFPPELHSPALKLLEALTDPWAGGIEFIEESDAGLAQAMRDHQTDRVRYAAPERVPLDVLGASAESGVSVVSGPVVMEGRLEMLWYLQEQSISIDYHRYGNLGLRAAESRTEPL